MLLHLPFFPKVILKERKKKGKKSAEMIERIIGETKN
jgi:hypothetical protein